MVCWVYERSNGVMRYCSGTPRSTTTCTKWFYNRDRYGHQTSSLLTRTYVSRHLSVGLQDGQKDKPLSELR